MGDSLFWLDLFGQTANSKFLFLLFFSTKCSLVYYFLFRVILLVWYILVILTFKVLEGGLSGFLRL